MICCSLPAVPAARSPGGLGPRGGLQAQPEVWGQRRTGLTHKDLDFSTLKKKNKKQRKTEPNRFCSPKQVKQRAGLCQAQQGLGNQLGQYQAAGKPWFPLATLGQAACSAQLPAALRHTGPSPTASRSCRPSKECAAAFGTGSGPSLPHRAARCEGSRAQERPTHGPCRLPPHPSQPQSCSLPGLLRAGRTLLGEEYKY